MDDLLSLKLNEALASPAGLFSVQKLYNLLRGQGIPGSKDSLRAYLSHLEDAFLVSTVSVHAGSARRRMVNPRKACPVDRGLITLESTPPGELPAGTVWGVGRPVTTGLYATGPYSGRGFGTAAWTPQYP